jgi:hypothetical protein
MTQKEKNSSRTLGAAFGRSPLLLLLLFHLGRNGLDPRVEHRNAGHFEVTDSVTRCISITL